jgi:hypothetical protein
MGAIGVHHTETSEGSWDGPANEARLKKDQGASYYRQAFAWQDAEGDERTKAAYRFIHHEVSGDGSIGGANLTACSAGIAVLNGGRGGTTIPEGDVRGVYNHLAAHLRDAEREVPELKSATPPPAPPHRGGYRSPENGDGEGGEEVEVRSYRVELRAAREEGKPPVLEGHAAVFDEWSVDLGGWKERIRAGAFAEALTRSDARALFNHDPNYVLGRQSSGTLELWEDRQGLVFRAVAPATQWASDLLVSIERGDIREGSISFIVAEDKWGMADSQIVRDVLTMQELYDVSVVTYPAYPQTSAQVRARAREMMEPTPNPGRMPCVPTGGERLKLAKRRLEVLFKL